MKNLFLSCIQISLTLVFLALVWSVTSALAQDAKNTGDSSRMVRAFVTNFGGAGVSVIDVQKG